MELIIFDRSNTKTTSHGMRVVNVVLSTGQISFSKCTSESMDLKANDGVVFAQEKNKEKSWFVAKAKKTHLEAFELTEDKTMLQFRSKGFARKLLKIFKEEKSIRFLVAKEYKEIDGNKFFQLIPYKKEKQ